MTQYCRYCAHFITGNGNWCEEFHINPTDGFAKRPNKCKRFMFCEIDAFDLDRTYKPRVPKKPEPEPEPEPQYVGSLFGE